jgi:hypothetical protein
MAKRLPIDLLERVQTALRQHPAGLALRELEARQTGVASRRSLSSSWLATWDGMTFEERAHDGVVIFRIV